MKWNSKQFATRSEKCRSVQDIGSGCRSSPWSGCNKIKSCLRVNADGYSRNRVKVCLHRRCVPFGMKKSGTAEEVYKIYAFVSLGCFNSNKEFEGFFIIVTITGGLICKQKE